MNDSRKQRKKMSLERPEPWHGPCLKWHGRATLCRPNPQSSRTLARPCATSNLHYYKFFLSSSLILPHKHLSSSKLLSKTSITNNLQTFISPSKLNQFTKILHPINSKHHPKHNPPLKNNFHPPKPKTTKSLTFITLT